MNHYHTHHSFTHTQQATHLAVPKKERKQEGVEEVIFNNPAGILSGIALPLENPGRPLEFLYKFLYKIEFSGGLWEVGT